MFIQTRKGLNLFSSSQKITGEMYFPYGSGLARTMQWINMKCGRRGESMPLSHSKWGDFDLVFSIKNTLLPSLKKYSSLSFRPYQQLWRNVELPALKLNKDCPEPEKKSKDEEAEFTSLPSSLSLRVHGLQAHRAWEKAHLTLNRFLKPFYSLYSPKATASAVQQLASHVLIKQW